ncbi:MAG: hypothetical protein FWD17_08355 [Polyangiaceae bacterium]|nr:hypothetical protein [Polyangiaceae bacterium]
MISYVVRDQTMCLDAVTSALLADTRTPPLARAVEAEIRADAARIAAAIGRPVTVETSGGEERPDLGAIPVR